MSFLLCRGAVLLIEGGIGDLQTGDAGDGDVEDGEEEEADGEAHEETFAGLC